MKITVIGLGHLGVVAAGGLALAGHQVTGVDVDTRTVQKLRSGQVPVYEPGLEDWVTTGIAGGNLRFFHRDEFAGPLGDVALVATGTPAAENGAADLGQVWSALAWVKEQDPRDLVLVMKSTVPPGTGLAVLEHEMAGTGVDYVANPEFLQEGRALEGWMFPERIILGVSEDSGRAIAAAKEMYSGITAPYLITDITSAEMVKYANNAFLATRISFINEIASVCDRVGASIDAVSNGLAMDPRTGTRVNAGIGYGGSCFPKDVQALDHLAAAGGIELDLLRSVIAVNNRQRLLPLTQLRARFPGAMDGLTVGVLGLAFKPGTNDVREAASLDVIDALVKDGAIIKAFDPQAVETARCLLPLSVQFVDRPEETAHGSQALALLTEWPEIVQADWDAMAASMRRPRFLFDGRNALYPGTMGRLGFEYVGVGRGLGAAPQARNREQASLPVAPQYANGSPLTTAELDHRPGRLTSLAHGAAGLD